MVNGEKSGPNHQPLTTNRLPRTIYILLMTELIIATTNPGKLREIRELLKDLDLEITSLSDYPGAPKVEGRWQEFRPERAQESGYHRFVHGQTHPGRRFGIGSKGIRK